MRLQGRPNPNTENTSSKNSSPAEEKKANHIDLFKHYFQDIWSPLISEDEVLFGSNSIDETRLTLDNTVTKFVESGRAIETWFAQRRLILKTPEQELEDEIQELKLEIDRKDTL